VSRWSGRLLLICLVVLVFSGIQAVSQMAGRFGLDLIARPIPATLTDEIKLNTPSEFSALQFAVRSSIVLNVDFGIMDLDVDAATNLAGPEHLVIKTPLEFARVPGPSFTFEDVKLVPEMWFAVPFESVTDVNNLPNSVVIPPGDPLFVKSRFTVSTTVHGFRIQDLIMLEDVNFPNPSSSFTPLYYSVQSQSFALGSLINISWHASAGFNLSLVTGISADQGSNAIKGYSAMGRVRPGYFLERVSVTGIKLGDINTGQMTFHNVYIGSYFTLTVDDGQTPSFSWTTSGSAKLADNISLSTSLTILPLPLKMGGLSMSIRAGAFSFGFGLDTLSIRSISANFNSPLNMGSMTGSAGMVISAGPSGLSGISMRLSLMQGTFSGGVNVSMSRTSTGFGFSSLSSNVNFRLSPAMISVRATFGRYGLTRASLSTQIVF